MIPTNHRFFITLTVTECSLCCLQGWTKNGIPLEDSLLQILQMPQIIIIRKISLIRNHIHHSDVVSVAVIYHGQQLASIYVVPVVSVVVKI